LGDTNFHGPNFHGQGAPLPSVAQSAPEPEMAVAVVQNVQEFVSSRQPEMAQELLVEDTIALAPNTAPLVTDEQPSLSDLVAQFEQAIEIRKVKLADLEAVASQLTTSASAPAPAVPAPRPPLEAVPASRTNDEDDEMDAALNAALATLQRMNSK
jgi:hypothetical protein